MLTIGRAWHFGAHEDLRGDFPPPALSGSGYGDRRPASLPFGLSGHPHRGTSPAHLAGQYHANPTSARAGPNAETGGVQAPVSHSAPPATCVRFPRTPPADGPRPLGCSAAPGTWPRRTRSAARGRCPRLRPRARPSDAQSDHWAGQVAKLGVVITRSRALRGRSRQADRGRPAFGLAAGQA
jgi:hypothetical protein